MPKWKREILFALPLAVVFLFLSYVEAHRAADSSWGEPWQWHAGVSAALLLGGVALVVIVLAAIETGCGASDE